MTIFCGLKRKLKTEDLNFYLRKLKSPMSLFLVLPTEHSIRALFFVKILIILFQIVLHLFGQLHEVEVGCAELLVAGFLVP